MNGPEDCGKLAGNGKTTLTSYINTWLFEGMAGNGQVLNCTPDLTEPTNECVTQLGPVPDCTTAGKPKSLTFLYTGDGCIDGNDQAADKWACSGVLPGTDPVSITIVKDPAKISVSPSSVNVGDPVTVSAIGSDMGTEIQLYVGEQFLKIHTSCSQPLKVGDVFGSLKLVAFNGQTAGNEVIYTYALTNNGDALTNVTLSDDRLGVIATLGNFASGEKRIYELSAELTGTVTNTATATGYLIGNQQCLATASATVTIKVPDINVFQASAPTVDKNKFYWKLTNSGPDAAMITKVEVTAWPSQQGKLKKIKLDATTAADPADVAWPGPATITSFVSDTARQIAAGQTRTFTIEFEKDYTGDTPSQYKFTIAFEGGETLSW